jgi:hypothetical protein
MTTIQQQKFENKFCDKLSTISYKQLYFENQNIFNPELRNEYKQLLDFCSSNKEILMGNDNLLNTVQSILKYNHRYINNLDKWKSTFSC